MSVKRIREAPRVTKAVLRRILGALDKLSASRSMPI
jgi:hypothetical protein